MTTKRRTPAGERQGDGLGGGIAGAAEPGAAGVPHADDEDPGQTGVVGTGDPLRDRRDKPRGKR